MIPEYLHEYLHILSDPAHVAAELTFIGVEALILTPIIRWFVRRHDRRTHGAAASRKEHQ